MNAEELAWAAGLIEGEGFFFKETSAKGYIRVGVGVTMTDRDILERLQGLVPASRLQGPYDPPKGSLGRKPTWRWVLNARKLVIELAEQLRPLMGTRRQEQIDTLIAHHVAHPAVRDRPPSAVPALAAHGMRTRYRRGCRCGECRRAESAYQRERRRAIRNAVLGDLQIRAKPRRLEFQPLHGHQETLFG